MPLLMVFGSLPLNLNAWVIPVAGLTATALLFLTGRMLLSRFVGRKAPPPQVEEQQPEHDPFAQGSTTERRSSVRRGGKLVEILISNAEGRTEPINGWVEDRSVGGLGLNVLQAFEIGTILSVRPQQHASSTPWTQVEVRRCAKDGKSWKIGCKFVRTPPWSILLMFG